VTDLLEEAVDAAADTTLFRGADLMALCHLLELSGAAIKSYGAGELIIMPGTPVRDVFIVLEGSVQMCEDDYFGNRSIFGRADRGSLFAEALAVAHIDESFVTAIALEQTRLLAINIEKVFSTPETIKSNKLLTKDEKWNNDLIEQTVNTIKSNLLLIMANRNIRLHNKLSCVTRRKTRDKVLAYLSMMAKRAGSSTFEIPLSRQELADFLCVDRSALSSELSRMQNEGIIEFSRNRFTLLV
jgi:CRP-like cAMP-binding protein